MSSFYEDISESDLGDYAIKSGLDGDDPSDLQQFLKLLKKGSKILEVGTGTGRLTKHLIKYFNYFGIENYKPYFELVRKLLVKEGYKDLDKRLYYGAFQDFKDKGFDAILFPWSVIQDFKQEEQAPAIEKAKSMLAPGGMIVIDNPAKGSIANTVPDHTFFGFYFEDWIGRFKKMGFTYMEKIEYETRSKRIREIGILKK